MERKNGLLPGFSDPVLDSMRTFRVIMSAMAHPGKVYEISAPPSSPEPLYPSTCAVCLTLLDLDTPLWIDGSIASPAVLNYLKFHCGCPVASDPGRAAFAIVGDGGRAPELGRFNLGDPLYPDRSSTVAIQVESLGNSRGTRLKGPGIEKEIRLRARGLNQTFWSDFEENSGLFPLGVDVILVSPESICCLPRTVQATLTDAGEE